MNNKHLYGIQNYNIIIFLINSFFLNIGYNTLTQISNNDSIIDILIGGIFIISLTCIIIWIKNYYKKNILEIINSFKYFKYPLYIIIITILGLSTIYSISTLSSFINYYVVKEINLLTIEITLITICIYLVTKNILTITRVSQICLYIYIFIMFIGLIGLIKYIDISNIKPLFISSINNHIKASFTFFNYSILPLFILFSIEKNDYNKNNNKYILLFTLISIIIVFLEGILIISVLGINIVKIYNNPDIIIYKKISFLNIFERIEIFLAFNQILNGIFLITCNIYLIKNILCVFIKKKKEKILLTLLFITLLFLSNTINITKVYYIKLNNYLLILILLLLVCRIYTSITSRN